MITTNITYLPELNEIIINVSLNSNLGLGDNLVSSHGIIAIG